MRYWRVVACVALTLTVLGIAFPATAGRKRRTPARQRSRPLVAVRPLSTAHPPSDPEVQKGLNAYGRGRYAEARRIAEGLLKQRNRGSTHSEAFDMLVESWLAEGNFAQARAAAQKYHDLEPKQSREALARISRQEKGYQFEVKQRQAAEAKEKKPEGKAQAHLLLGHVHHQYGRLDLAEKTYQEVVTKYPKTKAAVRAQRQLDTLHGKPRHPLNPKPAKQAKGKAKPTK